MPEHQKPQQFDNPAIKDEADRNLSSHQAYIKEPRPADSNTIKSGDIIQFMYDGAERMIFVLNPEWRGKLHGLSLKALDHRTFMNEVYSKIKFMDDPGTFYKQVVNQGAVKKSNSYRTYDRDKMGRIKKVDYKV